VTNPAPSRVHAIIPLAILEAMRDLDVPAPDGHSEFHDELVTKRLGISRTVAQQIERYRRQAGRDESVDEDEVEALLRLAARRPDAAVVFAEAGRRAARRAATRLRLRRRLMGVLPGGVRKRRGVRLAADLMRLLGAEARRGDDGRLVAWATEPVTVRAVPSGAACDFYGSAAAEALRTFTDFDGAVVHSACRTRGDAACRWHPSTGTGGIT
jgi:hypothetical protein